MIFLHHIIKSLHANRTMRTRRMRAKTEIELFRTLAIYMRSGLSILEALELCYESALSRTEKEIFAHLQTRISTGDSVARAFETLPYSPSALTLALLAIGEETGSLPEAFLSASSSSAEHAALKGKLIAACIYPAIILLGTIGIALFLVLGVLPKMLHIFQGMGTELPAITQSLLTLTTFVSNYGLLGMSVGLLTTVSLGVYTRKSKPFRRRLELVLLRTPLFGNIYLHYRIACITHLLEQLSMRHIDIISALTTTADRIGDSIHADALTRATHAIIQGDSIASALEQSSPHIPALCIRALRIGERTGTLPEALGTMRSYYRDEFSTATARVMVLIEPVLMMCMGLAVGYIALAIMAPIYAITQNIHG